MSELGRQRGTESQQPPAASCSLQRSATASGRPARSHAAAATRKRISSGARGACCALCTKPRFDQLPSETRRKLLLNAAFEPLAAGRRLLFCLKVSQDPKAWESAMIPILKGCVFWVLPREPIPHYTNWRGTQKLKVLRDHSTSDPLRLESPIGRASKLTRHRFQTRFKAGFWSSFSPLESQNCLQLVQTE